MANVKIEFNLDDPVSRLKLQMALKAESIYYAIKKFDSDERVLEESKDRLFEKFDEQKDGLIDLFFN